MTRNDASRGANGTARLDVDHPAVSRWAVRGLALLATTAFVVGAPALVTVGEWAGLGWAAWGLPVVVDLGLVIGAVSATVARQRQAPAGLLWAGTAALVLLSTVAQGVHSWESATVDGPARWVAIALGALPPLAVLWATEALIRLVVSEPVRRSLKATRAPQTAPAAAGVDPASGEPVVARRTPQATPPARVSGRPAAGQNTPRPTATDRAAKVAQARRMIADGTSVRAAADSLELPKTTLIRWLAADADPTEDEQVAA